jgi:outer membrane protein insertion porin family
MNFLRGLCAVALLLCWLPAGQAQLAASKVAKIEVKHVGPAAVSDSLVRANIRVKTGDTYFPATVDDDVRNLYATGLFYNVRVSAENTPNGLVLTYIVQGNPRLTEIKFQGNKKFSDKKLSKLVTSKVGEPFNERKLFTDSQEIQKKYQKSGYPRSTAKYTFTIDENTGRASATFEVTESPKSKIIEVDFVGAKAFPQKKLRKIIKTRKHWMFSWLTGSGYLKDDQFEEDKEKLTEFYRDNGYLDFEIKDVKFDYPDPRKLVIRFIVYEGTQYHVGSVKFSGNKLFTLNELTNGVRVISIYSGVRTKLGPNGLAMDVGSIFSPKGLTKDTEAIEDFYGSKGYLDIGASGRGLNVVKIPNTDTGTIDLEFQLEEGQKSFIEKIEIRGNVKTRDKVIRRELAVAPGEVFDMFRVKRSKLRLEGLQYFEKVDARPEGTDVPGRKNLVVSVDEKNTGNVSMGAGFSSIDQLVGFVELTQGNFDLFHPPTFTGGGQKFRLRLALGTAQQDYEISFVEPWFLGRKLSLSVDLFYRDLAYLSVNDVYDETLAGGRVGLTRALGNDFLIGNINYTLENVGIHLNSGWNSLNTPPSIMEQVGYNLQSIVGASLAYDTRNNVRLPNKGQRSELVASFAGGPLGGDSEYYKLEFKTGWYFKGLARGHVLELVGRTGVAKSLLAEDVPFYQRYYLGGLYSLRGYKFHDVSPREQRPSGIYYEEPVGGDSYWFGSAEYSIPIIEQEKVGVRFAVFYDVGSVAADPWTWNMQMWDDNYGFGLRLNLPIGPIRLDYGIPIHHDQFNSGSGRFGFGVGYSREF